MDSGIKSLLFVLGDSISIGYGPHLKALILAPKSQFRNWEYARKNEYGAVLMFTLIVILIALAAILHVLQPMCK